MSVLIVGMGGTSNSVHSEESDEYVSEGILRFLYLLFLIKRQFLKKVRGYLWHSLSQL